MSALHFSHWAVHSARPLSVRSAVTLHLQKVYARSMRRTGALTWIWCSTLSFTGYTEGKRWSVGPPRWPCSLPGAVPGSSSQFLFEDHWPWCSPPDESPPPSPPPAAVAGLHHYPDPAVPLPSFLLLLLFLVSPPRRLQNNAGFWQCCHAPFPGAPCMI